MEAHGGCLWGEAVNSSLAETDVGRAKCIYMKLCRQELVHAPGLGRAGAVHGTPAGVTPPAQGHVPARGKPFMSKGQVGSRITESQIITKTKSGESHVGNLYLSWRRPFQLPKLPVSWAPAEGKRERGDFLPVPRLEEVPALAPAISAARVGNQQPTFSKASQLSCNFYFAPLY